MSKTVSAVCLLPLLGCGNHDDRSFADEQVVALVNVACFDPVPDPLKAGWTKEGNGTATVGTPLALSDPSSAPSDFINYFCADSTIFAGDIVLTPHFTIARHDIHFCQKLSHRRHFHESSKVFRIFPSCFRAFCRRYNVPDQKGVRTR